MSEQQTWDEPEVPDYDGPAEPLPDYDPSEAEEGEEA